MSGVGYESQLRKAYIQEVKSLHAGETKEDALIRAFDRVVDVYAGNIVDATNPIIENVLKRNAIEPYKDAVWTFLVDHCDVLENGVLFFKFHASGRFDIEKRIYARLKGYRRNDTEVKEQLHKMKNVIMELRNSKNKRYQEQLSSEEIRKAVASLNNNKNDYD